MRFVRYPTLVDRKFVRFRNDERAFNHVLQFTDVTRPGILLQRFESLLLNTLDLFSRSLRVTIDKVIHEQWNVLFPFTQRRQFDGKNVEPVVKITAKGAVRDGRLQITIRRCNHADISAQNFRPADAFKLAFLQNAQ